METASGSWWVLAKHGDNHGGEWLLARHGDRHGGGWVGGCWPNIKTAMVVGDC